MEYRVTLILRGDKSIVDEDDIYSNLVDQNIKGVGRVLEVELAETADDYSENSLIDNSSEHAYAEREEPEFAD